MSLTLGFEKEGIVVEVVLHECHLLLVLISGSEQENVERALTINEPRVRYAPPYIVVNVQPASTGHIGNSVQSFPSIPSLHLQTPVLLATAARDALMASDIPKDSRLGALSAKHRVASIRCIVSNHQKKVGEAINVVVTRSDGQGDMRGAWDV